MALPPGLLSLSAAAARMFRVATGLQLISNNCLESAGQIIEAEAKRVIGTYDYGWEPLAESTIARKGGRDTPLLETGEMRDSISHKVENNILYVGSDNPKANWHEYGTSRIPPRPFLSGAALHMRAEVQAQIGKAATEAIIASLISGRIVASVVTGVAITPTSIGPARATVSRRIGGAIGGIRRRLGF